MSGPWKCGFGCKKPMDLEFACRACMAIEIERLRGIVDNYRLETIQLLEDVTARDAEIERLRDRPSWQLKLAQDAINAEQEAEIERLRGEIERMKILAVTEARSELTEDLIVWGQGERILKDEVDSLRSRLEGAIEMCETVSDSQFDISPAEYDLAIEILTKLRGEEGS